MVSLSVALSCCEYLVDSLFSWAEVGVGSPHGEVIEAVLDNKVTNSVYHLYFATEFSLVLFMPSLPVMAKNVRGLGVSMQ